MTVRVEVPTGREVREHLERWEAIGSPSRPWPLERWDEVVQRWVVAGIYNRGLRYDDDTPQPGLRLVPLPQPETEWVPWWEAAGRTHWTGQSIDLITTQIGGVILHCHDATNPVEVIYDHTGTVEVLVEPESATPTDPPEGWVVCRDREILRAAEERRMVRWWCGSWSDPLGGWDYDARQVDDDWFAVPVSMVPAEPWVPQVGDRVLVEAVVKHWADGVDPLLTFPDAKSGVTGTRIPASSLRPFPEDGEA